MFEKKKFRRHFLTFPFGGQMDDVGQKKLKQDLALYQNDELENDSLLSAHIFWAHVQN